MKTPGLPRALLVVGGLALAVAAGIGTAGSFGSDGDLWGDYYDSDRASGNSEPESTVLRVPAIRSTIDSMSSVLREALVNGEPGTMAGLYAEDAVHIPAQAPPVRGREEIRAHLEREASRVDELRLESRDVQVLSPEWATEHGTVVIRTESQSPASATEMSYALLFQKTDAGWKIKRDIGSSNGSRGEGT